MGICQRGQTFSPSQRPKLQRGWTPADAVLERQSQEPSLPPSLSCAAAANHSTAPGWARHCTIQGASEGSSSALNSQRTAILGRTGEWCGRRGGGTCTSLPLNIPPALWWWLLVLHKPSVSDQSNHKNKKQASRPRGKLTNQIRELYKSHVFSALISL